jgi:hypothetical protein
MTPETMARVVKISLETGNTDGAGEAAFRAAIDFLEEEMQDEHGIEIKIPIDVKGADYFYVPPSGDVLVNPEATMGVAKVFHVLGMADQWTMSSKCFDGANYGLFTGNDGDMKADNKLYVEEAKELGTKVMLMGEWVNCRSRSSIAWSGPLIASRMASSSSTSLRTSSRSPTTIRVISDGPAASPRSRGSSSRPLVPTSARCTPTEATIGAVVAEGDCPRWTT